MPAVRVPINGSVLAWANAQAGLTAAQFADRMGVKESTVNSWIEGQERPNKGEFDRIQKVLGRTENFFFLAHPPSDGSAIASFRTIASARQGVTPAPGDLAAVRQAENLQEVAAWLTNEEGGDPPAIPRATTRSNPEEFADVLRGWLEWDTDAQLDGQDYQAVRALRTAVEEVGIITLNLQLTDNRFRGFCIPDSTAPIIAVNTRDDIRARLLTYVHEIAHLALGDRSLCGNRTSNDVERWCENVAGCFFMPRFTLRQFVRNTVRVESVYSYDEVKRIANKFSISLRATAVRLEQTGLAVEGLYSRIDRIADSTSRGGGGGGNGPPQTRARRKFQSFGRHYVSRLLSAEQSGDLETADLVDLLNLSRAELRELRGIVDESIAE